MTKTIDRPLISARNLPVGAYVTAITGSAKTKTLECRDGRVTGFYDREVGNGFYVREAVVELANGGIVRTHRLMDAV